ncbi:hypothetical protein V1515DRAFT_576710 [Lipomyces mesembrius]
MPFPSFRDTTEDLPIQLPQVAHVTETLILRTRLPQLLSPVRRWGGLWVFGEYIRKEWHCIMHMFATYARQHSAILLQIDATDAGENFNSQIKSNNSGKSLEHKYSITGLVAHLRVLGNRFEKTLNVLVRISHEAPQGSQPLAIYLLSVPLAAEVTSSRGTRRYSASEYVPQFKPLKTIRTT